jgi:hypothetical protein
MLLEMTIADFGKTEVDEYGLIRLPDPDYS